MATTKLYLDTRNTVKGEPAPIKVCIQQHRTTALIPTDIKVTAEQFDRRAERIVGHPQQERLNAAIQRKKLDVTMAIIRLDESGQIEGMTAQKIKKAITKKEEPPAKPSFAERIREYAGKKEKRRTRDIYLATYARVKAFDPQGYSRLTFEDITREWLEDFDKFLAITAPHRNARNIHLRNIRAVFNAAIDDGLTSCYPFRRFKIHPEPTRKRALSIDTIRAIFNYNGGDRKLMEAADIFKLTFLLIGINFVDLFRLKPDDIRLGRVEYKRAKTGHLYSLKLEDEAKAILDRYKGEKRLISLFDAYPDDDGYKSPYNILNKRLKMIYPQLSTYAARHTWATIAFRIGVPKDTISLALGHSFGNRTTDIYIDYTFDSVDEANRKVIDHVLHGRQ